ncbi:MAG: glycosyltransferase family 4 protein [Planctomycetes bacterium]|nr:glycosyltransferase family 4 protein [Planctomycetota bacterium]
MTRRVALVVPGRFHAFDLGRALLARGDDVLLLTNYPGRVVERFGFPAARTRSFLAHGLLHRAAIRLPAGQRLAEAALHRAFGAWAARTLRDQPFDVVHCWSGVSEEVLRDRRVRGLKVLTRGSAHIAAQRRLLDEEERRAGVPIDKPSDWIVEREEREYDLADRIRVISSFARRTFLEHGCAPDRLIESPLATPIEQFRPAAGVVEARARRLRAGEPLRVLYVGALTCRKGLLDLVAAADQVARDARVRLVGAPTSESGPLLRRLPPAVEVLGHRPQRELPAHHAWADLFVFPTIEDGFAIVLAQAAGAGLPLITTPNCGGPELLSQGAAVWEVPIRAPGAIVDRLRWADANRDELASLVEASGQALRPRSWAQVAAELQERCAAAASGAGA